VRNIQLRDGREVTVRPTRTSDSGAMQELFYRLPDEDVETRFLQKLKSLTDTVAQYLCSVDHEQEMAFAAVIGPPEHERIVAASSYYLSPATGLAEVAYMVDPEWQGGGLGSLLHARMYEYARQRGVRGFRADVRADNARMMRVFERAGHEVSFTRDAGVYDVTMLFV
jgi:RimJ/RimL family protein N-acetyltransferase